MTLIDKIMVEVGAGVGGGATSIERSVDIALPGVHNQLHNIHSEVYNISQDVMRIKAMVSKFRVHQDDVNNQVHHFLRHIHLFQLPTPAAAEATIGVADIILPTKIKMLFRNYVLNLSMWNEWLGLGNFKSDDLPRSIEYLEKRGN